MSRRETDFRYAATFIVEAKTRSRSPLLGLAPLVPKGSCAERLTKFTCGAASKVPLLSVVSAAGKGVVVYLCGWLSGLWLSL